MIKNLYLAACFAAATVVAAGCAEEPAPATPTQVAVAPTTDGLAPAAGKKTCQTDDSTGSHITKRTVCMTDQEEREQKEALDQMRTFRGTGQGSKGN